MADSFIKKLLSRLNESKIILKPDDVEHSYSNNRNALVSLLSDHPYFIQKISDLRAKYELPSDSLMSEAEALHWELKNRELRTEITKEVRNLISSFTFNKVYQGDLERFSYEMVICSSRSTKWSKANIPSLVVLDTDENKQVNAHLVSSNSRYIQIFDWTTIKDIEKNWSDIQKSQKQKVSDQKGSELRKIIWHLKSSGLTGKEIYAELKRKHSHLYKDLPNQIFDESYIGVYAKRYEDSLKRLKDF